MVRGVGAVFVAKGFCSSKGETPSTIKDTLDLVVSFVVSDFRAGRAFHPRTPIRWAFGIPSTDILVVPPHHHESLPHDTSKIRPRCTYQNLNYYNIHP